MTDIAPREITNTSTCRFKKIIRLVDTGHDGAVNADEYFDFLMFHHDMAAKEKEKLIRKSPFHVRFYRMLDTTLKYLRNPPANTKSGRLSAKQKQKEEEMRARQEQMNKFKEGAQRKRNNLLKMRRNRQLQVEQMHKLFKRYDVSNDGFIGVPEMRGLIYEMRQLAVRIVFRYRRVSTY